MKTNRREELINFSLFLAWLIIAVIFGVFAYSKFKSLSIADVIIYSLAGLLANYALAIVFHELGHVVFAKACEMRIAYVNFGLFSIDFLNGKKVKYFTYLSPEAGETSFIPKKVFTVRNMKLIAFGGLLFSFIYAIGCLIPLLFIANDLLFCLLGIGSCTAFYLFTINLIPLDKTSDGAIVITKNDYAEVVVAIGNHQKNVLANGFPEEAPIFKKSNQPLALYYHYLYLLMHGRKDEAIRTITAVQQNLALLTDEEYVAVYPELLYISCERGVIDEELHSRAEVFFASEIETPAVIRAHYVYRKLRGEKEWAQTLLTSYYKSLKDAPLFVKRSEEPFELGK